MIPVFLLAASVYAWFELNNIRSSGGCLGFVSFGVAGKWINSLLLISALLLCHRLTITLGFKLLRLRSGGRRLPNILQTIVGVGLSFLGFVCLLIIWLEGEVSGILALSGAISVVLGLALRPIILDIFSGLSANMESAFQIGDWVAITGPDGDQEGWVEQINWRTTHLKTRSGNIVICPNSYLSTSMVTNKSRPYPLSRYSIRVTLPVDVSVDRAEALLQQAVTSSMEKKGGPSKETKPDVLLSAISGSGVEYWVRFWLDPSKDSYDSAIHVVYRSVYSHLHMAGVSFAVPREEITYWDVSEESRDPDQVDLRLEIIRGLEVFRGLGLERLRELAGALRVENYRAGDCIATSASSCITPTSLPPS